MHIPLASNGLREVDINAAVEVLRSGKLTMGENVRKFEEEIARYLGTKYFIMVNSGSSANLALIEAMLRPSNRKPRLMPGDGILVPAIAWPTTIWPIIQLGLNPIFIDVDPTNLAIDLKKAKEEVSKSKVPIKAIFSIHPLGFAIDHVQLRDFCETHNLIEINDVCESLGSWRENVHAGTSGLASTYSFYFSHHITTMEGGGIATNDSDLAEDLKSIRSHGWSRDRSDNQIWQSHISENQAKFLFITTGFNIRPMEIQAAIGLTQIKDIDFFIQRRKKTAMKVYEKLRNTRLKLIGGEIFEQLDLVRSHSWMLLPFEVIDDQTGEIRDKVISELNKREVDTRPILTGNFLAQPAMEQFLDGVSPLDFPVAEKISRCGFMVSAHHDLSDDQIEFLSNSLRESVDKVTK